MDVFWAVAIGLAVFFTSVSFFSITKIINEDKRLSKEDDHEIDKKIFPDLTAQSYRDKPKLNMAKYKAKNNDQPVQTGTAKVTYKWDKKTLNKIKKTQLTLSDMIQFDADFIISNKNLASTGKIMKFYRDEQKLFQKDLANKLKVNPTVISDIENKREVISEATFKKFLTLIKKKYG